jgi:phage-related tail fiber protein
MLWYRMVYENGTWGISISGTAATATTLATTRTFSATGDVTATAQNFNGSANVALSMVLANSGVTAGTYDNVTVDTKGRVTSATNNDSANISALII